MHGVMSVIEQIRQLPLHEKLQAMEAIWDDLSRDESALEVTQWHKDVLDEREQKIANGSAHFIEWDDAKKKIRTAVQ